MHFHLTVLRPLFQYQRKKKMKTRTILRSDPIRKRRTKT